MGVNIATVMVTRWVREVKDCLAALRPPPSLAFWRRPKRSEARSPRFRPPPSLAFWRRPKRSEARSPRRLGSRRNNPQTRHVSVNYSTRDGCPNPVLLASCASRAKMTKQRSDSMSFATRWNQGAIEEAYERWQQDPASVDDTWR